MSTDIDGYEPPAIESRRPLPPEQNDHQDDEQDQNDGSPSDVHEDSSLGSGIIRDMSEAERKFRAQFSPKYCEICGEPSTCIARAGFSSCDQHSTYTGPMNGSIPAEAWEKMGKSTPCEVCGEEGAGITYNGRWRCENHWVTTPRNHMAGRSGVVRELLHQLSDQELEEQAEYYQQQYYELSAQKPDGKPYGNQWQAYRMGVSQSNVHWEQERRKESSVSDPDLV